MFATVTLTPAELKICTWVGTKRYEHATATKRDPGLGPSRERIGPRNDIRGAKCEFAGSIILNLYWRPTIGEIKNRDLGGLVEVRTGIRPTDRLIIKQADDDGVPFILIIMQSEDTFQAPGWMLSCEAKRRFELMTRFGDPAHFVPQAALHPLDELIRLIHR